MSSPFKSILLIGAGGSIGSVVLSALLAEPSLSVTVLQRASSKSRFPPSLKIITVSDTYPTSELIPAFKGQDAIINCMATFSVTDQYRIIDAAVAAGVRRYSPSEYGLNNARADAQALSTVFAEKGAVQAYLRRKGEEGEIEWMSITCGMWVAWSVPHSFMGLDVAGRKMEILDDGEGRVSCTTEENTALAVVRALTVATAETKNRNVFLQDFSASQNELLAEVERQTGEKFEVSQVDSRKLAEAKTAEFKSGNRFAQYSLINIGFMTGRYGGFLEKEGDSLNERLGLKKATLAEEVAAGLARLSKE
ncbi:NAD(P)-binding protein [Coniochaeta ligniaria NRRL 30616]|uniref:NAD(P)-binding protein n=1 Tax=Coniochaeta ligniaria NRRL 30616 TaxID=1408157 RepID=A0A1J7J378_9PEZI|nr:NAD(P)-binding protein [Coniochaeta ligniaria NRRL 30616]